MLAARIPALPARQRRISTERLNPVQITSNLLRVRVTNVLPGNRRAHVEHHGNWRLRCPYDPALESGFEGARERA